VPVREYGESAALAAQAGADEIELHSNHDDVLQWSCPRGPIGAMIGTAATSKVTHYAPRRLSFATRQARDLVRRARLGRSPVAGAVTDRRSPAREPGHDRRERLHGAGPRDLREARAAPQ
jgi:hypothetical protein